jgi:hypothetical protein
MSAFGRQHRPSDMKLNACLWPFSGITFSDPDVSLPV